MIEEHIIERIKLDVSRYFPFYDFRVGTDGIAFFCNIREDSLEEDFDRLRQSLSYYGYVPIIRREGGEYVLYVVKGKRKRETPIFLNVALLIGAIVTTTLTGSLLVCNKMSIWEPGAISEMLKMKNLLEGFLQFSLPLLAILGVHEMAHYYTSLYHGVRASLPFFIPVPPVLNLNIGTFGALISSRDPIPNRKALFDIGLSGPLAGFLVAVPISIYGILNSIPVPKEEVTDHLLLQPPILFQLIISLMGHLSPDQAILLHPTAFAGWVGLIVTAVNLFPIGQLDGGHITRAVLGENQRYVGWFSVIFLLFTGWFFFAILIALMTGVYHPPPLNDLSGIDTKRKILFVVAIMVLLLCFTPFPVYQAD